MSVLNRDQFFKGLTELLKDKNSDESIELLEDFTDTYNYLQQAQDGTNVDWKEKYEENDKKWKERYRKRFFSGSVTDIFDEREPTELEKAQDRAETITIDNLFK